MSLEQFTRKLPDNPFVNYLISTILYIYFRIHDKLVLRQARKHHSYKLAYRKNPNILIYIPTFNRSEYLIERSIPSVLAQTYKNISILVVDDGSTDGTKELINQHFGDKVKVITNQRKRYRYPNKSIYHWYCGPTEAANVALKACNSDWIARIDDDDEWLPNHLEDNLNFAIKNKLEFVSSKYNAIDINGKSQTISADCVTNIGGTQTWLYHSGLREIQYNMHTWRKKWNKMNDTDLQNRIYLSGVRIGFNEIITCIIRPRKDEKYIGSKAYIENSSKYEDFYKI